jgi:hypothetical protein
MRRQSVSGQSYISLGLSFVGKTTDMIMQYTLLMPKQYLYMTYFSSTLAYFNILQLVVYTQPVRVSILVVAVLSLLLSVFVALLLLRTSAISIICPIGILLFLVGGFVVTRRQRQKQELESLPEDNK